MQKKTALYILIILLIFSLIPPASAKTRSTDSGIIRVLLTKLKIEDRAHITLQGYYTLNGLLFKPGTELDICLVSGEIFVFYQDMTFLAGKEAYFARQNDTNGMHNGILFSTSKALYTGDLRFIISAGQLQCILHIPVEEYLNGVVPYEMSDSYPLEALKAQAVAARTYAMKKKSTAARDSLYDVVDNTNDQVFYGYSPENTRAATAIKDTEGICGWWNGTYADCWYSASNGGQTELPSHVWNNEERAYLKIVDDPYDINNPESLVRSYTLSKAISPRSMPEGLYDMMLNHVMQQLEGTAYSTEENDISLSRIIAISLKDPVYPDSPSKLMKTLSITFTAMGRKYEAEDDEEQIFLFAPPTVPPVIETQSSSVPETALSDLRVIDRSFTVELPLYNTAENLFNLAINSKNNEIFSVQETADAFILESRRFGHGVGMSQRGAQWMALSENKNYIDILSFYYPGMKLEKFQYTSTGSTPVPEQYKMTPYPRLTATPRPTLVPLNKAPAENEYVVVVDKIASDSSLNLRAEPSYSGKILRVLYYGQTLIVKEETGDWLHVYADTLDGYIMSSFVTKLP